MPKIDAKGSDFESSKIPPDLKGSNRSTGSAKSLAKVKDNGCIRVLDAFLDSEEWCKQDWLRIFPVLTKKEKEVLDLDIIIRTIRSSGFMPQPERREKRNRTLFQKRVEWEKRYHVKSLRKIVRGKGFGNKFRWVISSDRVEQFRNLVFPMKMFGFNDKGIPLFKFSFRESNWKIASTLFKDKTELRTLMILSLLSIQEKLIRTRCLAACGDESLLVTGKFILVADIAGCGYKDLKMAHKLQLFEAMSYIHKFFPEMLYKTYVIHKRRFLGKRLLWPFLPFHVLKRLIFVSPELKIVEKLLIQDNFTLSQVPVELGGTFEGSYILAAHIS